MGKISALPIVSNVTRDEWVELIQQTPSGGFRNYRVRLSQLAGLDGERGPQGYRGNDGDDGLSAYELALANGFIGDQSEWLDSLKGLSAYEVAVQQGFVGTSTQWLDSLRGSRGEDGVAGQSAFELAVAEGFDGALNEWLATLRGASAYEVAQQNGFEGTETEWLASLQGLKGADGERGLDGKSAYQSAVENGYEGTEAEFSEAITGGAAVNGGVFITNISAINPTDNVGEKVMADDEYSLLECASTSTTVRVHLTALTGHSKYRPSVTVNGVTVELNARDDAPLFAGTVDVAVDEEGLIVAEHEDGATWTTRVLFDAPPVITSARFAGGYPEGQSEVKENDRLSVYFEADVDVVGYEIDNSGAFKAATGDFTARTSGTIANLVVANRGTTPTNHGFRIRVRKANGAFSEWYNPATFGNAENVNTVKLNNLYPTVNFGAVTYPTGQSAIKGAETATVNHTVTNYDTVAYSSTQLSIENPEVYAPAKVVSRQDTDYNISTNNFTVTATRTANGAVTAKGTVVAIAHGVPSITISTPQARLRSGGNNGTSAQVHTITLTSSQALAEPPELNAPEGTWVDASFVPNSARTVWTRKLRVHDDDAKGTFSWNSLVAKNGAGRVQQEINSGDSYVLGGFVFRTMTIPAFPNREGSIGTEVVNTAKLRCTNLSKGQTGSLNFSYQPNLDNTLNRFTITGPTGVHNPTGTLWYNLDGANASSNTGGTMVIEIEEVV